MADKFFEQEATEEVVEEPQTIKLGEKEYTQEDLSKLVGLGEMAREAEEKYKTPIDRVWPEYTKATQKMSDLERKIQELESKPAQSVQQVQTGVLTAEQRQQALEQLEALGIGPKAIEAQTRQIYREEAAAKDLLNDVNYLLQEAKDNGRPLTTQEELLKHMAETGIRNPAKAYKDMFEVELDALKEKQLAEIKPVGMVTTSSSNAGAKQPNSVKITKANLQSLVHQALGGE